jgi:hypothetical protein
LRFTVVLRCPRCKTTKKIVMRSRVMPWEVPADTRCSVCWRNGYTFTSMGIVRIGRGDGSCDKAIHPLCLVPEESAIG